MVKTTHEGPVTTTIASNSMPSSSATHEITTKKFKYCRPTQIYFCDGFKLLQISNTPTMSQIELSVVCI